MDLTPYTSIPFKAFGRNREGVDCWGLVCLIYRDQFGIELESYEGVDWKDGATISKCIAESGDFDWDEIPKEDRKTGDVVVLRILGVPWHVGFVINSAQFIHADPRSNVCVARFDALNWKNRIVSFHRLKS